MSDYFFCFSISKNLLYTLLDHYVEKGLVPRKLESGGRNNNTFALSTEDIQNVRKFIVTYAEAHAVQLPGRVPGFKRSDIQILPSDYPISSIYKVYERSCPGGLLFKPLFFWEFVFCFLRLIILLCEFGNMKNLNVLVVIFTCLYFHANILNEFQNSIYFNFLDYWQLIVRCFISGYQVLNLLPYLKKTQFQLCLYMYLFCCWLLFLLDLVR